MKKAKEIEIIWEYTVKEECLERFLKVYSPDGEWAKLFKKYPGYIKTDLKQDTSDLLRFITIDFWESFASYSEMKKRGKEEYESLDGACDSFMNTENFIGIFGNNSKQLDTQPVILRDPQTARASEFNVGAQHQQLDMRDKPNKKVVKKCEKKLVSSPRSCSVAVGCICLTILKVTRSFL